ncbi:MAG: winged helix-turn-helix domain-containing protein [Acutalibacteraceae bacterium]|nr:winged helix-turn-helix domain-containing protein [Acutalibacteraceae bacterium]
MMTKKPFDILTYLTTQTDSVSQRAISTATNMSVGTVNKQIAELRLTRVEPVTPDK